MPGHRLTGCRRRPQRKAWSAQGEAQPPSEAQATRSIRASVSSSPMSLPCPAPHGRFPCHPRAEPFPSDAGGTPPLSCASSQWSLLVAQPQPPGRAVVSAGRPWARPRPAGWRERFDELWKVRDRLDREGDGQVLSRTWRSTPPSRPTGASPALQLDRGRQGSRREAALGRKAWDAADKAIAANAGTCAGITTAPWDRLYSEAWGSSLRLRKAWKESLRPHLARCGWTRTTWTAAPAGRVGAHSSSFPAQAHVGEATRC